MVGGTWRIRSASTHKQAIVKEKGGGNSASVGKPISDGWRLFNTVVVINMVNNEQLVLSWP